MVFPTYSIISHLNSLIKGMNFPFAILKLPNNRMEEYSNYYFHFFQFHFFPMVFSWGWKSEGMKYTLV